MPGSTVTAAAGVAAFAAGFAATAAATGSRGAGRAAFGATADFGNTTSACSSTGAVGRAGRMRQYDERLRQRRADIERTARDRSSVLPGRRRRRAVRQQPQVALRTALAQIQAATTGWQGGKVFLQTGKRQLNPGPAQSRPRGADRDDETQATLTV